MGLQAELLDNVRKQCSIPSDNALSVRLDLPRQQISAWRKDTAPMADHRIAQLCVMAKLDAAQWLAGIHASRATDSVERKAWQSMLDRLRPIAAAVGLVALGMVSNDGKATPLPDAVARTCYALCEVAKRLNHSIRRFKRAFARPLSGVPHTTHHSCLFAA